LIRAFAGKETPSCRPGLLPVFPQKDEEMVAEHDAAILSSFSAPHMDEHALGVDITPGRERTYLGYSHARRIGCCDDGSTLYGADLLEDGENLISGEDLGKGVQDLGIGDMLDVIRFVEGDPIKELDRGHVHFQVRSGQHALLAQIHEERSNFVLLQSFRRPLEVLFQVGIASEIRLLRPLAVVSQRQI